jgi:hypothetical protein
MKKFKRYWPFYDELYNHEYELRKTQQTKMIKEIMTKNLFKIKCLLKHLFKRKSSLKRIRDREILNLKLRIGHILCRYHFYETALCLLRISVAYTTGKITGRRSSQFTTVANKICDFHLYVKALEEENKRLKKLIHRDEEMNSIYEQKGFKLIENEHEKQ